MNNNNRKVIEKASFAGFLFTVIIGSLFHFAFEFSGGNTLIGAFTPVNESIWEHLKLLLFPSLLFATIEYFLYGKHYPSFLAAKIYAILTGMLTIVLLYYTYSGILGEHFLAADIALFILAAAVSSFLTCFWSKKGGKLASDNAAIPAICLLAAIIILFIYFTFNPPMSELFRDPLSEDFGIPSVFYSDRLLARTIASRQSEPALALVISL